MTTTETPTTWTCGSIPVPINIDPKWDDEDSKNIQFFMEKCIGWVHNTKRYSLEKKTIMLDMAYFFRNYLYKFNNKGGHWGTDGDHIAGMCFKLRKLEHYNYLSNAQMRLVKELFKLWEKPEDFYLSDISTQCDWPNEYDAIMNHNQHPKLWSKKAMAEIMEYYMANWCSAFHSTRWKKH